MKKKRIFWLGIREVLSQVELARQRGTAKASAKFVMQHGVRWLRRRPRIAATVLRMVRVVPPLERRLLAFARTGGGLVDKEAGWALEPDPSTLLAWSKRLNSGKST
jgi:O-antigen chain-terminating methyltransferase